MGSRLCNTNVTAAIAAKSPLLPTGFYRFVLLFYSLIRERYADEGGMPSLRLL